MSDNNCYKCNNFDKDIELCCIDNCPYKDVDNISNPDTVQDIDIFKVINGNR